MMFDLFQMRYSARRSNKRQPKTPQNANKKNTRRSKNSSSRGGRHQHKSQKIQQRKTFNPKHNARFQSSNKPSFGDRKPFDLRSRLQSSTSSVNLKRLDSRAAVFHKSTSYTQGQPVKTAVPRAAPRKEIVEECVMESSYVTADLYVCFKLRKVALDCGASLTKVGIQVAELAVANRFTKRNKTFVCGNIRKRVQVITIPMAVNMSRLKYIECVIDSTVPASGVILGLQAMQILNYRLTLDGEPTEHHGPPSVEGPSGQLAAEPEPFADNEELDKDYVSALSEAEMRDMINSWQ